LLIRIVILAAWCGVSIAAVADSLPLTLKLWSVKEPQAITCTGKSWVAVAPEKLQREAVIVVLSGPNPLSNEQRLLACDDGSGNSAPVTGAVSHATVVHPGQTVLRGVLRVIALRAPSEPGKMSSIVFAVNTIAGDLALISRTGKGLIRVDHELGITVYPPSYELERVLESTIYAMQEPSKPAQPCTITYFADNPDAAPAKVIHSKLDCSTLMQRVDSNAIFSGDIPQQP
jgi:hypothetical protein